MINFSVYLNRRVFVMKWNGLTEVFLMSTYNVCFLWRNKKNTYLATPVWISWCYDKTHVNRDGPDPRGYSLIKTFVCLQDLCVSFPGKALICLYRHLGLNGPLVSTNPYIA